MVMPPAAERLRPGRQGQQIVLGVEQLIEEPAQGLGAGAPPKVIWLVIGNTSTDDILQLLLRHSTAIGSFLHEEATSLLTLRKC